MLKEGYRKKRLAQLAYAPVEYNYIETWAKTCINPARQNRFMQENKFNNAPMRPIAIRMNSNSGSFAENPFRYQQFFLTDIRISRGGQPVVHHDTTNICRLYVTTLNESIEISRRYSINSYW